MKVLEPGVRSPEKKSKNPYKKKSAGGGSEKKRTEAWFPKISFIMGVSRKRFTSETGAVERIMQHKTHYK